MTTGIILDIIIIAIIALCIFLSAKHGFVRTFIEVAGFVAAFFIAFTISSPLADITYDKIIGPSITSKVELAAENGTDTVASSVWNSFPDIIKNHSSLIGVSEQSFSNRVNETLSSGVSDTAVKISQNVAKPLITKVVSAFYCTAIAVILIILSKFLARALNKLFNVSIIGKINSALGGIIGIFKGLAFSFVFCVIISIVVLLSKNGFWIFTPQNIEMSNLFKLLYGFSPFV